MVQTLHLHPADNVLIAVNAIPTGTRIAALSQNATHEIPAGHKIAAVDIRKGGHITKCDYPIGIASNDIKAGAHVHTHNISDPLTVATGTVAAGFTEQPKPAPSSSLSFKGYQRPNGMAGTRNFVGILTTVNCSATVARYVADTFRSAEAFRDYPQIDGVVAFTHPTGCGMQTGGEGHTLLKRVIEGYMDHPNIGGVLLIGLGCEVNGIDASYTEQDFAKPFHKFNIQEYGGTTETVRKGVELVTAMLPEVNKAVRQRISLNQLTVGLQCGGSDAFSVVSSNPALGRASDLLVRNGGTVILSETPEVAHCAPWLMQRAQNDEIRKRLRERLDWWERYTLAHRTSIESNPAPGNLAGGISTLTEKTLGSIIKGGSSALNGVYQYAERVTARGFLFMDSPGFDPVSVTGQIASGANLVCFTTGRGSVFGSKPAPCIKLASNSPLYKRMQDDIDINCGTIVDGQADIETMGETIFEHFIATASGKPTKSESLGFGENEFAPWMLGAVL